MALYGINNAENLPYGNIEIYYETIEDTIYLDESEGLIGEILDITINPKIVKKYDFKAPLIEEHGLEYGYKLKLMTLFTMNIEFTDESLLGQTKVFTHNKLINMTINLPKTYIKGKTIKIEPSIIDVSNNLISKNKLYLSSFIKFTIIT